MAIAATILGGLGLGYGGGRWWRVDTSSPAPENAPPDALGLAQGPAERGRAAEPGPAFGGPDVRRRALLVGVTKYDHLPAHLHLSGPANDVRLLRRLLEERYQFPADRIVTLSGSEGKAASARRPTRANIEREFRRLADEAREGDQVVILLSGHGDRQPESNPPHPDHPEPDGIDEIFLPADVAEWKGFPKRVPNAIVDDEIGSWLRAITARKAFVWIIFDCCHSGTMTRGTEVVRELPPTTLVPRAELDRARQRAARRGASRGAAADKPAAFLPPAPSDYLVALYACRPHETTPEGPFPPDQEDAPYHGLLTYTLVQVLEQSAGSSAALTYRELTQRIQLKYAGRAQGAPTPLVEGGGQDRVVLGTERPARPRWTLRREGNGYLVNAGDLHGLTRGSVLAVYAPAGAAAKPELLGYARVASTRPFDSVVRPCAHDGQPELRELPELAPCQVAYMDYGLRRLKVAVAVPSGKERERDAVLKALAPLQDRSVGLISVEANPRTAEWVIRLDGPRPVLVEASGNRPPSLLPPAGSEGFARELRKDLQLVYHARSLLAVVQRLEEERQGGAPEVDVAVEVVLRRGAGREKVVPRPGGGWVFRPGDEVSFRVHNKSRFARADVSLLIVNPEFKITAFYPAANDLGKALAPGEMVKTPAGTISEEPPFGPEYLVVIAVPARNPPVDFALLTQEGLKNRGYEDNSPLAQLLERAMHRAPGRSGLGRAEVSRHAMRVLNWRTEPRSRE
jgi:hypothetical protein